MPPVHLCTPVGGSAQLGTARRSTLAPAWLQHTTCQAHATHVLAPYGVPVFKAPTPSVICLAHADGSDPMPAQPSTQATPLPPIDKTAAASSGPTAAHQALSALTGRLTVLLAHLNNTSPALEASSQQQPRPSNSGPTTAAAAGGYHAASSMSSLPVPASLSPRTADPHHQHHSNSSSVGSRIRTPWQGLLGAAGHWPLPGAHARLHALLLAQLLATPRRRAVQPTSPEPTHHTAPPTDQHVQQPSMRALPQANEASAAPGTPSGLPLLPLIAAWEAVISLPQRAWLAALWHAGAIAGVASSAAARAPAPDQLPDILQSHVLLLHTHAAAAVARVEEAVASGVVAAAAAASESSGLPLPQSAVARQRLRLLETCLQLQELLTTLQKGCTTHGMLVFLLTTLSPGTGRQLLLLLQLTSQRALQLAKLQQAADAWQGRRYRPGGSKKHPAASSSSTSSLSPSSAGTTSASSSSTGSSGSGSAASSGRRRRRGAAQWRSAAAWQTGFVAELRQCQVLLEALAQGRENAPGAGSSSAADAAERGSLSEHFDLRGLFRLTRLVNEAVAELQQQQPPQQPQQQHKQR